MAVDGGTPVGFAGYVRSAQWHDAVYLCRSGVLASHRGHGLQKRLIRAREQHARKRGYRWALTDTFDNPASSNSLISSGYRLYEPARPWGKRGALYWRKKLERTE
jgi:GNAT superfamily N-acetyltransferase